MADDMYSDGDMPDRSMMGMSKRDEEESESESQSALLPQSLAPGKEVGDVFMVRVEGITETDYQVSFAGMHGEEEEEEVEETTTETVTSPMDEMMQG